MSTKNSTTVLELAELIWKKIRPNDEFKYVSVDSFKYDVQKRIPDVQKAKDLIGFEAETTLSEMLDIVIPWIKEARDKGLY